MYRNNNQINSFSNNNKINPVLIIHMTTLTNNKSTLNSINKINKIKNNLKNDIFLYTGIYLNIYLYKYKIISFVVNVI